MLGPYIYPSFVCNNTPCNNKPSNYNRSIKPTQGWQIMETKDSALTVWQSCLWGVLTLQSLQSSVLQGTLEQMQRYVLQIIRGLQPPHSLATLWPQLVSSPMCQVIEASLECHHILIAKDLAINQNISCCSGGNTLIYLLENICDESVKYKYDVWVSLKGSPANDH